MSATRAWKVYGAKGHIQKASKGKSVVWDFSAWDNCRHITILREDITQTNDYVIIIITRESASGCLSELEGQLSDGFFESYKTGKVEEMELSEW